MKVRTDFVTNSSSSSFILFDIESETLATILRKYKALEEVPNIEKKSECNAICGNKVHLLIEDTNHIELETLWQLDEVLYDIAEILEGENSITKEGADELRDSVDEIYDDVKSVDVTDSCYCWGDSDWLYYQENFREEERQKILEEIAKNLECDIKDITQEDWRDYMCGRTSDVKSHYTYNRETGKETFEEYTTIEGGEIL